MMVAFEPPLVACIVSSAHQLCRLTGNQGCVIAIPGLELGPQVVQVGNSSGRDIDKIAKFGLTPIQARCVTPLIAECFAILECKVIDTRFVNKHDLFVLEVIKRWVDPKQQGSKTIHHRG